MPLWPTWSRHPVEAREMLVRFQRAAQKQRAASLECSLVLQTERAGFDSRAVHPSAVVHAPSSGPGPRPPKADKTVQLGHGVQTRPHQWILGSRLRTVTRAFDSLWGCTLLSIKWTGRSFPKREIGVRVPPGALNA